MEELLLLCFPRNQAEIVGGVGRNTCGSKNASMLPAVWQHV